MRIEKIDVKKEIVHVRPGSLSFEWIERSKTEACVFEPVEASAVSDMNIKSYKIFDIVDDNGNARLVGVEEEKMFKDVLDISNVSLMRIKQKVYNTGLNRGYTDGKKDGFRMGKADIRNMNWFRRLFKLF